MTIKSKIHKAGHEHESSWPPPLDGSNKGGRFYFDRSLQKMVEGNPPDENLKFGDAPQVIFDSMPKTYHEAACRFVESRKEWNLLDKQHGTITFGSQAEAERPLKARIQDEKKEYKQGLRKASLAALQMHEQNPQEMRQRAEKRREAQERIAKQEGLDKSIDTAVQTSLTKVK